MKSYKLFCGGEFIESSSKKNIKNKFTGEDFATVCFADEAILENAIHMAQACAAQLDSLSSGEKSNSLKYISDQLLANKKYLAEILSIESGKPIIYALVEIERAAQTFLIAAEECKRLPNEYLSLDWTTNGKGKEGLVKYFPAGIVAGISPFNFPMNLAVHKIAPALATGCPIILKPASTTPLSTLELAGFISKSGLPKGAVSILPMDRGTGNLLVTDERINVLSFTGSPEIGWELKKQSGKKKVVLELGGNAGVIISKGTEIKKIIDKQQETGSVIVMGTAVVPDFDDWRINFEKFARIKRDADGNLIGLVEYKDATEEEKEIKEVNPAYFAFDADWMWANLENIGNNNAQKEYYLTELVNIAFSQGKKIETVQIDPKEALGANSKKELEVLESLI